MGGWLLGKGIHGLRPCFVFPSLIRIQVRLPEQRLESRGGNQFRGIIVLTGGDCSRQSLILDLESEMLWTDAITGALASWVLMR